MPTSPLIGLIVVSWDFKLQQEQRPFCETCTFAKQQRLAFPHSYSIDSEAAEAETQQAQEIPAAAQTEKSEQSEQAEPPKQSYYSRRERRPPKQIYKAFVAQASTVAEPQTYAEALQAPDAAQWKLAMDEEMASLQENSTWTLEELPAAVKPIPVRWIFKVKRDALGNIERYKARLVAKGFVQKEGIDYKEVYAPASKHTTLRNLLALVASQDLELHQLDIKTAFLNGELEETIYMQQPEGYAEGGPNTVCHLSKSLYGLRQAPRAWHKRLKQELEKMSFTASAADPGLFTAELKHGTVYVLVYVDDILVAGSHLSDIQHVKDRLANIFKVRDLGEAKYFLGMSLDRSRQARTLKMTQERLATELVDKYGMRSGKTKSTPLGVSVRFSKATEDAELDREAYGYSELVGSLLYLSVCTRPDISQAVGVLARHMAQPSMEHWTAAKGVLRYIACTLQHGILYGHGSSTMEGYCDSDFASDIDSLRPEGPPPALCTYSAVVQSAGTASYSQQWLCQPQKRNIWPQHRQ